ncbi:MAG TPA: radical SAM family heme chaperone HemW [Nitrospinota bacterium]|jgi:oxygen-independent coproporphyrinogen-3 oxidase|nr:radical SAM family heme chaperone HemW [Nitrospinota bacterium]
MVNIALYIHIPYCKQKCPYCDFNSYDNGINKDFVTALKEEIAIRSKSINQYKIGSVFFGGGTPTSLSSAQITDILKSCFKNFSIDPDCEISIEANPGTIDYQYLKLLRKNGFNRLSLGCQSFNDDLLKKIGRIHDCDEIYHSVSAAREAGFKNISLDLMFGLPEQSLEIWEESLQNATQLKPTHLSLYNLTIEKETPFYYQLRKGELILPSEELQLKMYERAVDYLSQAGYTHYEISNFAVKGYECRHNKVYWNNNEYLSFGPGAASYLNGTRSKNILSPGKYIETLLEKKEIPLFEKETLDQKKSMGETLMLGLRMVNGVNVSDFEKRFGKTLDSEFGEKIRKLRNEQFLEYSDKKLKLTHKGILFSNEVFVELV